jgi:hypothetical protein
LRIFKNKVFTRFARKSGISDAALCKAVIDAERGLIDADLGGGVIKQRVAREGGGKSGGFRTMVLFRTGTRAFFVYGFAKNERDNIELDELTEFRRLATRILNYSDAELRHAISNNKLIEVFYEDKAIS